ncbi:EstA family serine hydrolase [Maricurvus nonylphenolicus]|uniref:serine hydrolase domain-containing protein n=1 Tax=Maricurvus nonylphenolicus TaxID=1008307 RepID=UPI0036F3EA36
MTVPVQGYCDSAFSQVREAFTQNFIDHGELGAACSVYIEGKKVVDLWGGFQDKNRSKPWQQDTLVGFYSVSKAIAALCTLQLVDQGLLALDKPIASVWPEFAANGKEQITLRQLLSHQAGLISFEKRLTNEDLFNWSPIVKALEEQAPWFEPGTQAVYHTNTYGHLIGEPLRRITGKSVGQYLQEHISQPLNEEVYFGLPDATLNRVADIVWHPSDQPPPASILDNPINETQQMVNLSYFNPPGFAGLGVMNGRGWRQAEVPSTNGHGTARGIAHVYQQLAGAGKVPGPQLLSQDLLQEATTKQSENFDCPVLGRPVCFGLGFQPTRDYRQFGPNAHSFGHFGSGGSAGFGDPDCQLGFGYVMNDITPRWQSPRNQALIDAVYGCL